MPDTIETIVDIFPHPRLTSIQGIPTFPNWIEGLQNSDVRISKLEQDFGTPPKNLDDDFQAPNIWLTLGSLAEHITPLQSEL